MRKRVTAAVLTAGIAVMGISAIVTPAQATTTASWHAVQVYNTKSLCVDAGQQYQREGFPYKCTEHPNGYLLWIWN